MFITFLGGEEAESFTRSVVELLGECVEQREQAVLLRRRKVRGALGVLGTI